MCGITHSYVWHDAIICVTWHLRMCDMSHAWARRLGPFTCKTRLTHSWGMTHSYACHDSCMTHSYVRYDSFISEPCHTPMCDMTHSRVRGDSFIYMPERKASAYLYVRHDAFIREPWCSHVYIYDAFCVTWRICVRHDSFMHMPEQETSAHSSCIIHVWDITHSYVRHNSFICQT